MSQLPLRKLTLYKQGIGYFERRASFEGSSVSLVVPRENINDTLKSLQITELGQGQVLGVDYETPSDKEKVLNELSVKLGDRSSMVDLLQSLRGTQVQLHMSGDQSVVGRLVGVEASLEPSLNTASVLLQADAAPGKIQVYPISQLSGLLIQDERSATDVSFFLDISQTEQTRATVTIRLSEGRHELDIAYLAPSPTWRVRYQLVSTTSNQARLFAWGIFDNKLDEDLEDVSLTLISGRPISFEYDLYDSYIPSRPQISDDPLAFEAISTNPLISESLATMSHEIRTPLTTIIGYAKLLQQDTAGQLSENQKHFLTTIENSSQRVSELLNDLLDMSRIREGKDTRMDYAGMLRYGAGQLGDLKVSSSYFMPMLIGNAEPEYLTYEVETLVSVRRKQSAMVPIAEQTVDYEELCVFNGDKMPNHPLRVWRMKNTIGKALEQGPVTLIKDGKYQGEGLIRFTGVGDEFQVPYALEFGIVITEETNNDKAGILKVEFDGQKRRAKISRYRITELHYRLTSHIQKDTNLLIEKRDPKWGEYFEMPQPASTAGGHTRWEVTVPGSEQTSFIIKTRTVNETQEELQNWGATFVNELRAEGLIKTRTFKKFELYWSKAEQELQANQQSDALQVEYSQLLTRQKQLRENLGALGSSDREIEIRNRILDDLDASENRRRELENQTTALGEQIRQLQVDKQSVIDDIYETG